MIVNIASVTSASNNPKGVQSSICFVEVFVKCAGGHIRPSGSRPSRCSDYSIPFQTRGFGSCMGKSNLACSAMYNRSLTSAAHESQVWRCCSSSGLPPASIMCGRISWNCWQSIFILSQRTLQGNTNAFFACAVRLRQPRCTTLYRSAARLALLSAGGLFGSAELQQVAQFHARLMQLRLAVPNGAAHHFRNFVMFVTFHVMQYKDDSVSRRQALYGPFQVHPVDRPGQHIVPGADILLRTVFMLRFQRLIQRYLRQSLLAQVHQHHVYRQPVQPG